MIPPGETPGPGYWESIPLGRGVVIVARDPNGLAALAKPEGVLSHPNTQADERRSLVCARYDEATESFSWPADGGVRRLWLLNRLDSATSGVILVADTAELAADIRAQFRKKQVRKVYVALVFGSPRLSGALWKDTISVVRKGGFVRSEAGKGGIPAESRVTILRPGGGEPRTALIRLEPRTGRSHQLRVQCARRGLPIVGDQTYGDFKANRAYARSTGTKRMFLHSLETTFEYVFAGQVHTFSARAPLPPEFEAAGAG